MLIQPIPKKLLPHSVVHHYNNIPDTWQNPVYGDSEPITSVRVDPETSLILSKDNKEIQFKALMFWDVVNSSELAAEFVKGDKIVFNSISYYVETIEYLYDDDNLHHIELGLI